MSFQPIFLLSLDRIIALSTLLCIFCLLVHHLKSRNMSKRNSRPAPPVRPQPTHTSIVFHQTQKRYAQRPINHFPWKDFHLQTSSQGYVVGSDWAMVSCTFFVCISVPADSLSQATFDNRTDDQFFDSKRLQTVRFVCLTRTISWKNSYLSLYLEDRRR